jgi:hypothetical protein
MHRRKLPLRIWFAALHIVTSHSNGISVLQLQGQLGLGSWNTAWLLPRKIRSAMAAPEGEAALLRGVVEVDGEGRPGRARLAVLPDYSAEKIGAFSPFAGRWRRSRAC